jgi:hypothetical protein
MAKTKPATNLIKKVPSPYTADILSTCAFVFALVSWMTTASGLNKFAFSSGLQGILISFGIQGILVVMNLNLPEFLSGANGGGSIGSMLSLRSKKDGGHPVFAATIAFLLLFVFGAAIIGLFLLNLRSTSDRCDRNRTRGAFDSLPYLE